MMSKKASLLWVDLEMTGLSPEKDRILEVAAIATDWDLKPVAEFTGVVKVPDEIIAERMVGEFWEKNKASYRSLVEQNKSGKDVLEVEGDLLEFIDAHFGDEVYHFNAGDKIVQMVILPVVYVNGLIEVDTIDVLGSRGVDGFGSTGV